MWRGTSAFSRIMKKIPRLPWSSLRRHGVAKCPTLTPKRREQSRWEEEARKRQTSDDTRIRSSDKFAILIRRRQDIKKYDGSFAMILPDRDEEEIAEGGEGEVHLAISLVVGASATGHIMAFRPLGKDRRQS